MKKNFFSQKGATFVEIIVVFGVVAMIFGLTYTSTFKAQQGTTLQSFSTVLVSDIKNQQVNAMTGFTLGGSLGSSYGIYFEGDRYTLFKGDSFNPSDSSNFVVDLPENIQISEVKFPSSTLVFLKGSGEIAGYYPGSDTVSLKTALSTTKTFSVNKYGAVTGAN